MQSVLTVPDPGCSGRTESDTEGGIEDTTGRSDLSFTRVGGGEAGAEETIFGRPEVELSPLFVDVLTDELEEELREGWVDPETGVTADSALIVTAF